MLTNREVSLSETLSCELFSCTTIFQPFGAREDHLSVPSSILYLSNIDFRFRLLIAMAGGWAVNFSGHTSTDPLSRGRNDNVSANLRPYNFLPIVKLSYRMAILPKPPDFSCANRTAAFQTVRAGGTAKRRNVSGSLGMQGEDSRASGIPYRLSDPACIRSQGKSSERQVERQTLRKLLKKLYI